MTETLFNPKEMYTLTRPTKISKKREEEFLRESAQWIIDNEYADAKEIEEVIEDLRKLLPDSPYFPQCYGYRNCLTLESESKVTYKPSDKAFIDFMDGIDYHYSLLLNKEIEEWVAAIGLKPKRKIGDKIPEYLKPKSPFLRMKMSQFVFYITGISDKTAEYAISRYPNKKRKRQVEYIIPFESLDPITT